MARCEEKLVEHLGLYMRGEVQARRLHRFDVQLIRARVGSATKQLRCSTKYIILRTVSPALAAGCARWSTSVTTRTVPSESGASTFRTQVSADPWGKPGRAMLG